MSKSILIAVSIGALLGFAVWAREKPAKPTPPVPFCWERLVLENRPPNRFDTAIATDSDNQRLAVFGGRTETAYLNDFWFFNVLEKAWQSVVVEDSVDHPPPRTGASLVRDVKHKRWILFGGVSSDSFGKLKFFSDLWIFDDESNRWRQELSEVLPPPRSWHLAVASKREMVIFGGYSGAPRYRLQDVWALDLDELTWRRVLADGGPNGTGPLSGVLSESGNELLLFGTGPSLRLSPYLWKLDLENSRWSQQPLASRWLFHPIELASDSLGGRLLGLEPSGDPGEWKMLSWDRKTESLRESEVEYGPVVGNGLRCSPSTSHPEGWICVGGVFHNELSGDTWQLEPCRLGDQL